MKQITAHVGEKLSGMIVADTTELMGAVASIGDKETRAAIDDGIGKLINDMIDLGFTIGWEARENPTEWVFSD